jgi:hypothetical protein
LPPGRQEDSKATRSTATSTAAAGQRFHNHSPLDFEKLLGDPDHIELHLVSYINGFSKNVRDIFDFFEFEQEIEKMRRGEHPLPRRQAKFCDVDLHPGQGAQRADGPDLREPDPPLQRTGQRDRGRPLHAARGHPADGEHPVHADDDPC